jgi:hypothetical protein
MTRRETEGQTGDVFQASDLKICDLCGSLNLAANCICCSCGWHGHFESRPNVVALAMEMVRMREGAIRLDHVADARSSLRPHPSLIDKLRRSIAHAGQWLFG